MKRCLYFVIFAIVAVGFFTQSIYAQDWSGVLDSTVNYTARTDEPTEHSFGFEQYANLRLRIRTRENATFHAAFNLIAVSGNFARQFAGSGLVTFGENYAAAMDLERLYVRIAGENIDTEAGLLRMNFGYGQVWGSSDFLNPRNPLAYNARPRGVLGFNSSFYPTDTSRLMVFAAGPKNPLEVEGGGIIPGLVFDQHWSMASLQAIYAYETPGFDKNHSVYHNGLHRFGLSLKADLELGFVADMLYTLNPDYYEGFDWIEGLSAGLGFDYSFLGGDLYILAEYLYSGSSSVTSSRLDGSWLNNHYLYGTVLYRFNDFFNMSLSTIFCFDDLSFQPILAADYELFQGFSLNLNARVPLDRTSFGGSSEGELGPSLRNQGIRFILNVGARLRF